MIRAPENDSGGTGDRADHRLPASKRAFDLIILVLASPLWIPVFLLCSLAVLAGSGMPVFYRSRRRIVGRESATIVKFRAMVRNADRFLNRDSIPINGQRFLNIPLDNPAYTRIGRILERGFLTEIPQLLHVAAGRMSLVGNRPLPESVITALREVHPAAEERFAVRCGMTGPVQLVGRDNLGDGDRIRIERAYCRMVRERYRFRLDAGLLLYTVLRCVRFVRPFEVSEVLSRMECWARPADPAPMPAAGPVRPHPPDPPSRRAWIRTTPPPRPVRALEEEA